MRRIRNAIASPLAAGAVLLGKSVLADPSPIATLTLPGAGNANSFGVSVRYDSGGILYVWDGVNVWKENGKNSSAFSAINPTNTTVGSGSADPGPINFDQNQTHILVGNGAGGGSGKPSDNGLFFMIPKAGGSSNTAVGAVPDHLDAVPVPTAWTIPNSSEKFLVDAGNSSGSASAVSVFDAATGTNTPLISSIPGADASLAFDAAKNLFVDIGFGAQRGQIREFSSASVNQAFNTATPLPWTAGTLFNPASSDNQSGAGMFLDTRGFLFAGGSEGVTVFGPDHMGRSYGLGSIYSSVSFDPADNTFLLQGLDNSFNTFYEVFNTSDFVPEPASLALLGAFAGMMLIRPRRRRENQIAKEINTKPDKARAALAVIAAGSVIGAMSDPACASQFYATTVVSSVPGASQPAAFSNPALALGGPLGAGDAQGSLDVYKLGIGNAATSAGTLTLGFDLPSEPRGIQNLPGPDFTVFANPFYVGGDPTSAFVGLDFVEVSSDGSHFARFPVVSSTPSAVPAFGTINPANVSGFAGVHPAYANVSNNFTNAFDPAVSGGDSFDLSALSGLPAVQSGQVDLNAIRYVRVLDVLGDGTLLDSSSHPIFDPTGVGNTGGDVDAIAVIHGEDLPEPDFFSLTVLAGGAALLTRRRKETRPRGFTPRGFTPRGFTLVEILVVIGIIAILLALLLPTLSAARAAAQSSFCQNNLRQMTTASINYAQDYGNYWPPAAVDILEFNLCRWHGSRLTINDPFKFSGSPLRPYLVAGIKACPDFVPSVDSGPMAFEASAGGYGYNNHYLGASLDIPAAQANATSPGAWDRQVGNVPAKQSMVRHPANKIAFTDAAMARRGGALIEYSFVEPPMELVSADAATGPVFAPSTPSIHFRHRGRANIAWADGHVSSETMEWTYAGPNVYGGDNQALKIGYFGPRDNTLFQRE